ncbi:related to oxidoreductase [Cephalotrichum gorgonifer]|uniref:Related to oxidoreductase n=1 Tax=Cephalotrichum gorgonifer TaxID=2041049 RepID=A0AAE8MSG7_9PEZI|nr:related to oxidoreductase [Cephalotrichum gorgonifer]
MAKSAEIPIIDFASGRPEKEIAKELCEAAITYGFIYIRSGALDVGAVDRAFDISKHLFSTTDVEEKKRCSIQKNNRGWTGIRSETLDPKTQKAGDFKEAFNFGEFVDGKAQQPVPNSIADREGEISDIFDKFRALAVRILYLLGVGLEVNPPDFFSSTHLKENGSSGTTLRFLHYPSVDSAEETTDAIRAGAHTDYGSVTLLFRLKGQAGLQILTPSSTWAPVPVCPPTTESDPSPPVLVNIGDMLSYWTNGLLKSTTHRVAVPTGDGDAAASDVLEGEGFKGGRYSIALFCHPAGKTRLEPVPSEVVQRAGEKAGTVEATGTGEGKVLTADEHLATRLKASYIDLYKK